MNQYTLGAIGAIFWCGFSIVGVWGILTDASPIFEFDTGRDTPTSQASFFVTGGVSILIFPAFVLLWLSIRSLDHDHPSILLRAARYLAGVGLFPILTLVLMRYIITEPPVTDVTSSYFVLVMVFFTAVPLIVALFGLSIVLGLYLIQRKETMGIGNLPRVTGILLILSIFFVFMPIATALLALVFLRLRRKAAAPSAIPLQSA